jgi:hypothetical protein
MIVDHPLPFGSRSTAQGGKLMYETVMEKAVDQLLDSHGYSGPAMIRPVPEGVEVLAERKVIRDKGGWRLVATVTHAGEVISKTEVDW